MTSKTTLWRERLAAWRTSGTSAAAFCRTHELAYPQFVYWKRRLGKARTGLVPVSVVPPTGLSIELKLAHGVSMHVRGVSTSELVTLVQGLSC